MARSGNDFSSAIKRLGLLYDGTKDRAGNSVHGGGLRLSGGLHLAKRQPSRYDHETASTAYPTCVVVLYSCRIDESSQYTVQHLTDENELLMV